MIHDHLSRLSALAEMPGTEDGVAAGIRDVLIVAKRPKKALDAARELLVRVLTRQCRGAGVRVDEPKSVPAMLFALRSNSLIPIDVEEAAATAFRHAAQTPTGAADDPDLELALVGVEVVVRWSCDAPLHHDVLEEMTARVLTADTEADARALLVLAIRDLGVAEERGDKLRTLGGQEQALMRVRKLLERIFRRHCEESRVPIGHAAMVGQMIDELRKLDAISKDLQRVAMTALNHANPALHEGRQVGAADLPIALTALACVARSQPQAKPAELREAPSQEREHKLCTAVVVNVTSNFEHDTSTDFDDATAAVDARLSQIAQMLRDAGAEVPDQIFESQVIAVFGSRRVREDDGKRAVEAALAICTSESSAKNRDGEPATSVRAGVATGKVTVNTGPQGTARGQPVDLAKALALAHEGEPGMVLMSSVTAHLEHVQGRFNVEPKEVKPPGRPTAVLAYIVLGRINFRRPLAAPLFHNLPTALVGRQKDLAVLQATLQETLDHRSASIMTLVGDAGVGRSRMLAAFYQSLAQSSDRVFLVLQAQPAPVVAAEHAGAEQARNLDSYDLVRALLRGRFGVEETDSAEVAARKLRVSLRRIARQARRRVGVFSRVRPEDVGSLADSALLADAIRQVSALLDGRPGQDTWRPEEGEQRRTRLAAALARLARFGAEVAPLVVVCDDIQWADRASLALLADVVERCQDMPVFVLCTARRELTKVHPQWGEPAELHTLADLKALRRPQLIELVRDHLRRVPDLPQDLVEKIVDRAGLKPFFVVALLHFLVERQVIVPDADPASPWKLHVERFKELALPAAVEVLEQARLDALSANERRVLLHAAVIGRDLSAEAIGVIEEALPAPLSWPAVYRAIETLVSRRILLSRPSGTFPGEEPLGFAEGTMQEVAYGTLEAPRRKAAHLGLARWLSKLGPDHAVRTAQHFEIGGDGWSAASMLCLAAERNSSLGSHDEAITLLCKARELQEHSGPPNHPVRGWNDRVRVLVDLGRAQRNTHVGTPEEGYLAAEGSFLSALRLLDGLDASAKENRQGLATWRPRVEHNLADLYKVWGQYPRAMEYIQRAIEGAEKNGALRDTLTMRAHAAFLHRRMDDPAAAHREAARGLCVARRERRAERQRGSSPVDKWAQPMAQLLFAAAVGHIAKGRFARAERDYSMAARLLRDLDYAHELAQALNGVAGARIRQNNTLGAKDMFIRSLELKMREGDLYQIAVAHSNLSETLRLLGEVPEALAHARESVTYARRANARGDLTDIYRNLAEALFLTGDIDEAIEQIRNAEELAHGPGKANLSELRSSVAGFVAKILAQPAKIPAHEAWARATAERLCAEIASAKIPEAEAARLRRLLGC